MSLRSCGLRARPHSRKRPLRNPATCRLSSAQFGDGRKHMMKRTVLLLISALWLAVGAAAQDHYPSRPIKVLVPYAPGGAVDIVARIVTEEMRQRLGQPFIIENKPGAYGILAIQDMARARPDGYTIMFGNN